MSKKSTFQKIQVLDRLGCFERLWTVFDHYDNPKLSRAVQNGQDDLKRSIIFQNSPTGLKPKIRKTLLYWNMKAWVRLWNLDFKHYQQCFEWGLCGAWLWEAGEGQEQWLFVRDGPCFVPLGGQGVNTGQYWGCGAEYFGGVRPNTSASFRPEKPG